MMLHVYVQPVYIPKHYTKSKLSEFAFQINQNLSEDKSFSEWATTFCEYYFQNTAESANVFLINKYSLDFCMQLTMLHIEQSSIEHVIRS